jgi:predicted dehydrogenase
MPKPVSLIIIGAGSRGKGYGDYALAFPDRAKVVGVAEPRPFYRESLATAHDIPAANVVDDWRELAERKIADAVVISTPDHLHTAPAIAFATLGYDILLEKPMAPTADECRQIVAAVEQNGSIFAVGHVLRYTAYTRKLKELVDSGLIGEVVNVDHLEPVGFWHQAHSFVRGNWGNEARSSFMLLAKSCHDIDWLRHIMGRRCTKVASFGSLLHFRREQKPAEAGAALRCVECAYEPQCPYSAPRFYMAVYERGWRGWPLDVITTEVTPENIMDAVRTGPYGRCVYECDNDVVDHQVVNLEYEGGATASFTMTAFCEARERRTRIFGTRGELRGGGDAIIHYDFLTDTTHRIEVPEAEGAESGHGGGDFGLMASFIDAVATRDQSRILTGPAESLETHLTVFAAEEARRRGCVIEV